MWTFDLADGSYHVPLAYVTGTPGEVRFAPTLPPGHSMTVVAVRCNSVRYPLAVPVTFLAEDGLILAFPTA